MTGARFAALALLALGLASCSMQPGGPPLYAVEGRVFFEDRPAEGAVVILHAPNGDKPGDSRPRGKADADGHFVLSTFQPGDGAAAGEYVVTVEWKRRDDHPEQGVDLLPPGYADPKKCKLRAVVAAGPNDPLVLRLTGRP
jgi:hypothetical protein